ncbi:MAG: pyridoxamine 5'-phosphate oxidase family protein [Bacteroidia bacterium]
MISKEDLYQFMRRQPLAVVASVNAQGLPESAVVGIAVTPQLEIVFDTVNDTRKYANLLLQPRCSIVIGWEQVTVQLEGFARLLGGSEDENFRECYYASYPDGIDRMLNWPGLVHFVVQPSWIRYSDFGEPRLIREFRL